MKCTNHPEKDAACICNLCAKNICIDCAAQLRGESYCKDCLAVKMGGTKKREHSPALAAILSFIIAGLGQIYNGQIGKGLLIFLTFWLVFPWIIGIFDAYAVAKKINEGTIVFKKRTGCLIAMIVGVFLFWAIVFVIALLAAIAIPNFTRVKTAANEDKVKITLKSVSNALELYATQNNNTYPESEASLSATLPLNNREVHGYYFKEELKPSGYKITAIPVYCYPGGSIFTIETGGKLSQEKCQREDDDEQEDEGDY